MHNKTRMVFTYFHLKLTGVNPPPGFIPAAVMLTILLIIGTFFYHFTEHWNYLDSLYFCVTTLSTVSFGDLHPSTDLTKIFTMVYIFLGVGLGFYILSTFTSSLLEGREKRLSKIERMMKSFTEEEEKTAN